MMRLHDTRDRQTLTPTVTIAEMAAESTSFGDWPGRYYHIDQVLNTPGPRTDPAFLAGDGVRDFHFSI